MKIRNKQTGQIIEVTEDQLADYGLDTMAKGGMIKRADGSYSRRGLWDNIRANKGSGKKPTKAMLAQEKKIRAAEKAYGGYMDMGGYMNPYMAYGGYLPMAQDGIGMATSDLSNSLRNRFAFQAPQPLFEVPIENSELMSFPANQISDVPDLIERPVQKAATSNKNLGLVDYLASQGLAFDKESRKKYAKELGIKDYDFSGIKNEELLKKIKKDISKIIPYGSKQKPVQLPEVVVTADRRSAPLGSKANPVMGPEVEVGPVAYTGLRNWSEFSAPALNVPNPYVSQTPPLSRYITGYGNSPLSSYAGYNPSQPKIVQGRREYGGYMAQGGINNPGFRALPDYVQQNIIDNMAYGGCKECGGRMEAGGKLPKEVLRARLESHMSPGQAQNYLSAYGMGGYLDEAGDGKWMQKATASIKRRGTEGVCTGSKFGGPGCPPGSKRYNLAKTFRKMAKSKKEEGGYAQGGEYEMTDAEIAKLRSMGYKIKEV
jgi:hypothetical protein